MRDMCCCALPLEIKQLFEEWLARHMPDRAARVLSLIRQTRGGALYDSRFGVRQKGTGVYADLLAQRFAVAARRLGLERRGGGVGAGYLDPEICGASYIPASLLAARTGSLALVLGMTMLAGMAQVVLARFMGRLRRLFPPEVTGAVVFMVGFAIVPHALRMATGLNGDGTQVLPVALVVSGVTLGVTVAATVWGRGSVRLFSVLYGIGAGYLASWALGLLGPESAAVMGELPWFALPQWHHPGLAFDAALVLPFLVTALSNTFKTTGEGIPPSWR